ncbi:hypothetical protein [Ulvibacterium sp.]|uniref:hypothetical protein n=1 Tax=Ulvibacterium sp. TaxID=2665914 RepID=UPI00262F350D|nr:hypothetical protein [Ulvibacterium sp.]
MDEKSKIRINLTSREFEIEGSEEFIAKYNETIDSFLDKIYSSDSSQNSQSSGENSTLGEAVETNKVRSSDSMDSISELSFGELYHKLPNSAKDVDKILLAGYYAQLLSEERIFSTREASNLLVEQGVKLSNASAFMKSNMSTKKVFKHKGGYRVSDTGIAYIKNTLLV